MNNPFARLLARTPDHSRLRSLRLGERPLARSLARTPDHSRLRSLRLGERPLARSLARHRLPFLSATAPRPERQPTTEHRAHPGFQYICTLNIDYVPRNEFSFGFRIEDCIGLRLTDADVFGVPDGGEVLRDSANNSSTAMIAFGKRERVGLIGDGILGYGARVATKVLNQAVKRNAERFPPDFLFALSTQEVADMRSQIVTGSRSQSVTLKRGHNIKYLPYAFTEHGAIMAAAVLNSPQAVEMSVFVVRAFIKMREQLLATTTLAKRLAEVEKLLLTHDSALRDLYQKIRPLLLPPPEPERKAIGFGVKERRAQYRAARKPSP